MSLELIKAAAEGNVATIHALLNPYSLENQVLQQAGRFPNLNAHEPFFGNTALHSAVMNNHTVAAYTLLYYGANPYSTNNRGLTPHEAGEFFHGNNNIIENIFEQQQLEAMGNVEPYNLYSNPYDSFN